MEIQHAVAQQGGAIVAEAAIGLGVAIAIVLGLFASHWKKPRP